MNAPWSNRDRQRSAGRQCDSLSQYRDNIRVPELGENMGLRARRFDDADDRRQRTVAAKRDRFRPEAAHHRSA